MTPMALAITSQIRLCHAAPATACGAAAGSANSLGLLGLMDSSIVHFKKTIATFGQASIMRGHYESDTFSGYEIEQEIEDGGSGAFVK